jgi:hypothetical protein
VPLFTSETGLRARQRKAGLAAARYWRERDFENLVRAREARSRYAALRREWFRLTENRRHALRYYPDGPWECDCGLNGDSTEQVVPMHRKASRIEAELYVRRKSGSRKAPALDGDLMPLANRVERESVREHTSR